MTARDWESEPDPFVLLDFLFPMRGQDSTEQQSRQSRLYLLGCARRAWDRLPWVGRPLIEIAERIVEREAVDVECRSRAHIAAEALTHCRGEVESIADIEAMLVRMGLPRPEREPKLELDYEPEKWTGLAHLIYYPFAGTTPYYRRIPAELHSAELIREVFGSAVRSAVFDANWRDRTVVAMARGIYATRDFSGMPILADALEDAGCQDEGILEHCRDDREHIRGCWVLDEILHRHLKSAASPLRSEGAAGS